MKFASFLSLLHLIGAPLLLADQKPNLIVYMIDDLGWNQIGADQVTMGTHTGCFITPNIEKIANRGLSFTHAYTQPNSPLLGQRCSPVNTRPELTMGSSVV